MELMKLVRERQQLLAMEGGQDADAARAAELRLIDVERLIFECLDEQQCVTCADRVGH